MNCIFILSAIVSLSATQVSADYECICNRHAELKHEVLDSSTCNAIPTVEKLKVGTFQTHTPIGYMFPNDCATSIKTAKADEGWLAIQFEQETAYIKDDDYMIVSECPERTGEDELGSTFNPIDSFTWPTTGEVKTISPALSGNVALCPQYVIQGAKSNGYLLTQHGRQCYEVCQTRVSWTHANMLCKERGGHLVTIHNVNENNYLHNLLTHNFNHPVWIGLNDMKREEHFQWTTGERLSYTNWKTHHRQSQHHNHEDCVAMLTDGSWDDVQCGGTNVTTEATHQRHAYVCEYLAHHSGSFIIG